MVWNGSVQFMMVLCVNEYRNRTGPARLLLPVTMLHSPVRHCRAEMCLVTYDFGYLGYRTTWSKDHLRLLLD